MCDWWDKTGEWDTVPIVRPRSFETWMGLLLAGFQAIRISECSCNKFLLRNVCVFNDPGLVNPLPVCVGGLCCFTYEWKKQRTLDCVFDWRCNERLRKPAVCRLRSCLKFLAATMNERLISLECQRPADWKWVGLQALISGLFTRPSVGLFAPWREKTRDINSSNCFPQRIV